MKKVLERLKSRAVWAAVAGALWVTLSAFGIPERIGITSEGWNAVLNALGGLLTVFGIFNNPADRENF